MSWQPIGARSINPGKLMFSKWTAAKPVAKQKHFLVTKIIFPELPDGKIEWIEIEAVYTREAKRIRWQELRDESLRHRGWLR